MCTIKLGVSNLRFIDLLHVTHEIQAIHHQKDLEMVYPLFCKFLEKKKHSKVQEVSTVDSGV